MPEVAAVPIPMTEGEDAAAWLATHGYLPKLPSIRSRDYGMLRHCPRTWFLSRCLRISPALRWSKALVQGSWTHAGFSLAWEDTPASIFQELISSRLDELKASCLAHGIIGERQKGILDREEHTARTTQAWLMASADIPVGTGALRQGWLTYLRRFKPLCVERIFEVDGCVIQPDALLMVQSGDKWIIFIIDFKTCSESAALRASACPVEFQTQHYFHVLEKWLRDKKNRDKLGVPHDAEVGGVVHLVLRKPPIRFGDKDRDFTLDTSPFTRGERKGQPRNEKKYSGVPQLKNFAGRCRDWFLGQGDYLHEAQQRVVDPCINLSTTPSSLLRSSRLEAMYDARMGFIRRYFARDLQPSSFEPGDYTVMHGRPSPYLPFHLLPVHRWPQIIKQDCFQVGHPDGETNEVVEDSDES